MEFSPLPPRFRKLAWTWQAAGLIGGAALMAAASQVEFDIGPVPLTLQSLAVFLLAGTMGQRAGLSIALWLLAAALGAPVLSGGAGGWADVMGPTQGYLLGMVLGAVVAGKLAERVRRVHLLFAAFVYGHAVLLMFGVLGLLRLYPPEQALGVGLYPFIVGALIKVTLATAFVVALAQTLRQRAPA